MKVLKSIFTALALVISIAGFSQRPGGPPSGGQQGAPPIPNDEQIEKIVSALDKDLDLTDEQETKILDIYIAHYKEVKKETSGNARPNREKMNTLKDNMDEQVEAVLTKKQYKSYKKLTKRQQPQRPQR